MVQRHSFQLFRNLLDKIPESQLLERIHSIEVGPSWSKQSWWGIASRGREPVEPNNANSAPSHGIPSSSSENVVIGQAYCALKSKGIPSL